MRRRSLVFIVFAFIPGLAKGEEPAPLPAGANPAVALSDQQKQEKTALLDKKLEELKRLQAEIKQLREVLDEPQQIGLELQVIEFNRSKIRSLGFDWENIKKIPTGPSRDVSGFFEALAKNNLAKIIAEPRMVILQGSPATFKLDDGTRNVLTVDCTPSTLDSGKIHLTVKFEITRFAGEDFRHRVRASETTAEVEPGSAYFVVGDIIKRTRPNGDQEVIELVLVIKPSMVKR